MFLKGVKAGARIFVTLRLGKCLPHISFNVIRGNALAFVVHVAEAHQCLLSARKRKFIGA